MLFLSLLLWLSLPIPKASPWTITSSNQWKRLFDYNNDENNDDNLADVGSINMRLKELSKSMDYFMSFTKEMYEKMKKILDKMAMNINLFHKNEEDKIMGDEYENEYENSGREPTRDELLEDLEGDNTRGSEPTLNERSLRLLKELEGDNTTKSQWRSGSPWAGKHGKKRRKQGGCLFDDSLLIKDKSRGGNGNGKDYAFNINRRVTQWGSNNIPYFFDYSVTPEMKRLVRQQMRKIIRRTCIRFEEMPYDQKPYHHLKIQAIYRENIRCVGEVSFPPQHHMEVKLTLIGMVSDECAVEKIILHELLHVLGFAHTHRRSDRDDYMSVNEKCISGKGWKAQYYKSEEGELEDFGIPYMCQSIMHYHEMSKDPQCPILTPKKGLNCKDGIVGGQSAELLDEDWLMIYIAHCCKLTNKSKSCWTLKKLGKCNTQHKKWKKWMGENCAQSCNCTSASYEEFRKNK